MEAHGRELGIDNLMSPGRPHKGNKKSGGVWSRTKRSSPSKAQLMFLAFGISHPGRAWCCYRKPGGWLKIRDGMTNMTGVDAYPLCWPAGRPRTQYPKRSRFETSFGRARDSLMHEINLLGGRNAVLSTNIPLRRDGLPFANYKIPTDKGVAVYFTYKNRQMCFACDAWDKIEDNMQAVWKTIEALRGIARWGTGDMMERAFTGFEALPAPGQHAKRQWWQVLGVSQDAPPQAIKEAYRSKAKACHPDIGGDEALMTEINAAYSEATRAA